MHLNSFLDHWIGGDISSIGTILLNSGHRRGVRVRVMVFNTTLNNISVISWRSVLLVKEAVYGAIRSRP